MWDQAAENKESNTKQISTSHGSKPSYSPSFFAIVFELANTAHIDLAQTDIMDAFSIVSVAGILFTNSASALLVVQNFVRSAETVERLQREFVVLHHVLKDCHEMITENTTVPRSIDVCLEMCLQKYHDLLKILEDLLAKPKYWRRFLYTFKEHELLTTYNGFRDSVLLLRDLSTGCVDDRPRSCFLEANSKKTLVTDMIQHSA